MKKLFLGIITIICFLVFSQPASSEIWVKYNTQQTLHLGPFVDETDGITPIDTIESAGNDLSDVDKAYLIDSTGTEIDISGNAFTQMTNSTGWYSLVLATTDTDAYGPLYMTIQDVSECVPKGWDLKVVHGSVYDSHFGTDKHEVDLVQMGGVAQSATDLKDFADSGYDPSNTRVVKVYQLTELDEDNTTIDLDGSEVQANITKVGGDAIQDNNDGRLEVNVEEVGDSAINETVAGHLDVNVTYWEDSAITDADGLPDVNATLIEGGDATDAINAAVDVALDTAIPGAPTADSINERIETMDDSHFHTSY